MPSCWWQFSNVAMRFGVYGVLKERLGVKEGASYVYAKSMLLAGISGACAALVSNPFFILKSRAQAARCRCGTAFCRTTAAAAGTR